MSEFPPGSFEFADRIMNIKVEDARREVQANRQAAALQAGSPPFYCATLARLGHHLAAWGARLQERYSTEDSAPTPARAG